MKTTLLFLTTSLAGCTSSGGGGGGGDADIDADADTDADSDGDGDQCPDPPACGEAGLECYCNGTCFDLPTDDRHCGACFRNCQVAEGAYSGCLDGECVCGDSTTSCGGSLDDWCCPDAAGAAACVDLLTDELNCGTCDTACEAPASNMCRNGICTCGVPDSPEIEAAPCPAGQQCCGKGADGTCMPDGSC